MSTVKYYKGLGLEFVDGDLAIDEDGGGLMGICVYQSRDDFIDVYGEDIVTKFAWRNNTGEAPSYKGDIEVELKSGQIMLSMGCMFAGISRTSWPIPAVKWRPVLVREETKLGKVDLDGKIPFVDIIKKHVNLLPPEDEQAIANTWSQPSSFKDQGMSVHYELTSSYPGCDTWSPVEKAKPVEFKNGDKVYSSQCPGSELVYVGSHPDGGYVAYDSVKLVRVAKRHMSAKPIDTRTDEQKLAHLIMEVVGDFNHSEYIHPDLVVCLSERIIKEGYAKP